jgi:hypothetical protein
VSEKGPLLGPHRTLGHAEEGPPTERNGMSESDPTGYGESPDTGDVPSSSNLVDGVPGEDRADAGDQDITLTTDDEAQRDDETARPGNTSG